MDDKVEAIRDSLGLAQEKCHHFSNVRHALITFLCTAAFTFMVFALEAEALAAKPRQPEAGAQPTFRTS